jgi:hypothetical protein
MVMLKWRVKFRNCVSFVDYVASNISDANIVEPATPEQGTFPFQCTRWSITPSKHNCIAV